MVEPTTEASTAPSKPPTFIPESTDKIIESNQLYQRPKEEQREEKRIQEGFLEEEEEGGGKEEDKK
jgi:hypothetical protein